MQTFNNYQAARRAATKSNQSVCVLKEDRHSREYIVAATITQQAIFISNGYKPV